VNRPSLGVARVSPGQAEIRALRVAQETAAHVPAYARLLRLAGYDSNRLRSFADFCALPLTDKASYLARYSVEQRCRRGDLARAHIVTLSSGATGLPTLWPRFPEQDAAMVEAFTALLEDYFRISERWTLLVVALPMGAWVAGTLVAEMGQRIFAQLGMRGTVATPGLNQEETLRFVEQLSRHYDQTIFVTSPTAMPELLAGGERRGIVWPELNAGVLTGGESVSEWQRERILRGLGKDPERLEGMVALFGSAEAGGILGYETHLCLLLRRLCTRTPALTEALFGSPVIPSVHQYNPLNAFLETHDGELLLTMRGAVPLIRYNTHDRGGILTLEEVVARCRFCGYDVLAELRARGFGPDALRPLPFLYVFGRSDAVIIHSANVYTDHLAHVLEQAELQASATGNFRLGASADPDGRGVLQVEVELRRGVVATEELRALYQQGIVQGLQRVNSEFRDAYASNRGRLDVEVALVPFGAVERTGVKGQRLVREPDAPRSRDWPSNGNGGR
jgi:phenylacetate-CoA ligase